MLRSYLGNAQDMLMRCKGNDKEILRSWFGHAKKMVKDLLRK
jgi:hypothetical protein